MRKFAALVAMLLAALTMSVFMSGGAAAASNGDHDQEFTCTTPNTSGGAGTTFTSVFSYHITGVGTSANNTIFGDQWAFHTSPAAQLDAVTLSLGASGTTVGHISFQSYGTGDSVQNDVSSSWSTTNLANLGWADGSAADPIILLRVTGGVGNGSGSCTRERAML